MARRAPLWLTLVPLVAGGIGYYALWTGYAGLFQRQLAAQLHGRAVSVTGFPYRVSATVATPHIIVDAGGFRADATAAQVTADRTPWRPELTVLRLTMLRLQVGQLSIASPAALASVHVEHGRLARLSVVYDRPAGAVASLGANFTADRVETHLRTAAAGAELVVRGNGVRIDGGDPVAVNGAGRGDGAGGVAIGSVTIDDAVGTVAVRNGLAIDTVCPATIDAALTHGPAFREYRLRQPVRLGPVATQALPASARRLQLPPCPVLRRQTGAAIASRLASGRSSAW